jgi:hypothetical protein
MQFESKHQHGWHFEHVCTRKPLKVIDDSIGKTSTKLWKWCNRILGTHTARCHLQDVTQQRNVHPSTINRLLVSTRRRHRPHLKTTVLGDRRIVTTSRRNRFVSAFKAASELHPTSGVRKSEQSLKNRLLWDVNLPAQMLRVLAHLNNFDREMNVAWATTRLHWTLR